jgi:hypothetical protein
MCLLGEKFLGEGTVLTILTASFLAWWSRAGRPAAAVLGRRRPTVAP